MNDVNILDILVKAVFVNGSIDVFKHEHTFQKGNKSVTFIFGVENDTFECKVIVINAKDGYIIRTQGEGKDYLVDVEEIIPQMRNVLYDKYEEYARGGHDTQGIENMFHNQIWEMREV